ncbi:MAG TPA: hypothetical protein VG916_03625, partial [Gemmatimonadaceae bacterium]|nr:hypothetical protein [Gemmatimonadaceae bacterium]
SSLAGWRKVSRRLSVRGVPAVTLLDERWDDRWRARWITFGDPSPDVVTGPGGVRGFWNRGDGTFPNVAILRRALDAHGGLGIEARLATAPQREQWQRARILFLPGVDTAALKASDQKKAPVGAGVVSAACGMTYPAEDGRAGAAGLGVVAGGSQVVALGRTADTTTSGEWWTVRVQILPDGRCGVAVNGRVVWLSDDPIDLDGTFWLRLGEQSADSRLLHGPMRLWTGVRTDIDWQPPRP